MITMAGRDTTKSSMPATPDVRTATSARAQNDADALALLTLLADLPAGSPDRARARERLVEMYLPLAEHLARRFRHRGELMDDLVQVASLALLKSIDGFDPNRGAAFTSYAIPMIVGELKRHFRDKGCAWRSPRSRVTWPRSSDAPRRFPTWPPTSRSPTKRSSKRSTAPRPTAPCRCTPRSPVTRAVAS
jgi:RNA polymerase sigma-B factor